MINNRRMTCHFWSSTKYVNKWNVIEYSKLKEDLKIRDAEWMASMMTRFFEEK